VDYTNIFKIKYHKKSMEKKLAPGRNELDEIIMYEEHLENWLIKGRYLQTDCHDTSGEETCHWHRKILKDYNPDTGLILLSEEGSLNSKQNLEIPDHEFTIEELYETRIAYWMLREKNWKLF